MVNASTERADDVVLDEVDEDRTEDELEEVETQSSQIEFESFEFVQLKPEG